MSNHFIIPYIGNKRGEYKEFIKNIEDINKYNIIIEPFCGSSAISFNIWKDDINKDKIYYLNDNDKILIEIYKLIKNENPDDILIKLNDILKTITDKEIFLKEFKKKDKSIYEILFFKKYYAMREGLYPIIERFKNGFKFNKEQLLFIDFIKSDNVIISNNEWIDIFDEFKDNENALFIFDPPYMNSCNDAYDLGNIYKKNINVYEYFFNNDFNNYKSHIVFILEDMWVVKLLFKNNIKNSYFKLYQMNSMGKDKKINPKKKTNHIIITN